VLNLGAFTLSSNTRDGQTVLPGGNKSEARPVAALFMADLLQKAALPDGVFNVVHGDKVALEALLAHPDVKAVSFVGSTPVANNFYETGARHGKRVQALGLVGSGVHWALQIQQLRVRRAVSIRSGHDTLRVGKRRQPIVALRRIGIRCH
jgi:hypothetical protein